MRGLHFSGVWSNLTKRGSEREKDIIEVLRSTPIFAELSDRDLKKIAQIAYQRIYDENETIFREGQSSAGMYIIKSGEVRIVRRSAQGEEITLAVLGEGDFFGEVGLLYKLPRTASAIASTRCQLVGFFRPELFDLMDRDPRLAAKVLYQLGRIIAQRLIMTNEQYERLVERLRDERGEVELKI
ncbi:TPA: cyclic nucleotide-binding domain-containing protein [Candidatus Poribacteria bacterium]|nr:cyclic nucleotide-binding domain-containing protein [Candidatus Poribacteria bacterium]HEX28743.1 cyclic nucleotide-binding domain-containing protein [Candidatus Poribacteria bacterium]